MRIVDGGLLTTVQDLGRYGYQKIGVSPSGAMDTPSLRRANILVGNPDGAAALELTLRGPVVEFASETLIALCGADLTAKICDVEIPRDRAIAVRGGSLLTFGRAMAGCRAYLAVAGGIDVPVVMGSRSTYLRASIGGYEGRALRTGDDVAIGTASPLATRAMAAALSDDAPVGFAPSQRYATNDDPRPASTETVIRYVAGPHFGDLRAEDKQRWVGEVFEVSPQADRMGYRLRGPRLSWARSEDVLSSAVTMGTVQLPLAGEPIVLMADRQTTGGYRVIAQVITADLPLVAQLKPGDRMRFTEVGLADAQQALRDEQRSLDEMRKEVDARASDRSQR